MPVVQCEGAGRRPESEGAGRRPESEGVGAAVVAVAAFEVTVGQAVAVVAFEVTVGQEGELALVVE